METLQSLTQSYLCNELSPEESQQLQELIESDAEALGIFSKTCILDGRLRQQLSANAMAADVDELFDLAALDATSTPEPSASEISSAATVQLTPHSRLRNAWEATYDVASNYWALSLVVSGLFFAILLLSMAQIVLDWKQFAPDNEIETPIFVAEITDTREATWDESSDGNSLNIDLFAGERLVLNSGLAEITFADGAIVLLEGPANFIVNASGSGKLEEGKLAAKVTAVAIGFVVDTPFAKVTDLGTEFGIALEEDQARVVVYEGEVHVANSLADGHTSSNSSSLVKAGDMATVTRNGVLQVSEADQHVPEIARRIHRHKQSVTNNIANHSFELPATRDGTPAGDPPSWTVVSSGRFRGVFNPGKSAFPQTEDVLRSTGAQGKQVLYIDLPSKGDVGTITSQGIATVQTHTTYTLSVAVGRRLDHEERESGTYLAHLLVDGSVVASSSLFDGSSKLRPGTFETLIVRYESGTAPSGTLSIRIDVAYDSKQGGFQQAIVDNARLSVSPVDDSSFKSQ